jgi:hypothetical protein
MIRWPWRRQESPIEPRRAISHKAMELETAKEILAEGFPARSGEVEEMTWRGMPAGVVLF